LNGTPWFARFLKLEAIRQASIPYPDPMTNHAYTPFQCVDRIVNLEVLADAPSRNWLPIELDLVVNGVGPWRHKRSIYIPDGPVFRPTIEQLLAGPLEYEEEEDD
jgi:hypothetical protein